MPHPLFTVPLADVERHDVSLEWTIPAEWLDAQLADTEARSQGQVGQLTASLAKNGREILVQATARVDVVMPCARTLDPVPMTLESQIYLLLTPKGSAAKASAVGAAARGKALKQVKVGANAQPDRQIAKKPRGNPRPGRDADDETDALLSMDEAARDTFEGDQIVLDGFIREHIVLELPLFPLRSDLRSEDSPAIGPPAVIDKAERKLDPRLAPLAAIASKMREKKE